MNAEIIRFSDDSVGFCKYFNYALNTVEFLHRNRIQPIISLNSNMLFSADIQEQIKNWNLIFPQCFFDSHNIDDINGLNVNDIFDPYNMCKDFWNDAFLLKKTFYDYMKIGNCIVDRAQKIIYKHDISIDKCLFLRLRGTDYFKFSLSSIDNANKMINIAQTVIKKFNLEQLYLITEDDFIKNTVKNKIQKCKLINCEIANKSNKQKRINDIEDIISYVSDIYIMSKSQYVIMTETNSSLMYNIFRKSSPKFQYCSR